jgi:hypothetical protein
LDHQPLEGRLELLTCDQKPGGVLRLFGYLVLMRLLPRAHLVVLLVVLVLLALVLIVRLHTYYIPS